MPNRDSLDVVLNRAVRGIDEDARRGPDGTWHVAMTNGASLDVRVHVDEAWLDLAACAPKALDATVAPWSLLRANADLRGGTRVARGRGGLTDLRAEILVGPASEDDAPDDLDLPMRLAAACAAIHDAYVLLRRTDLDHLASHAYSASDGRSADDTADSDISRLTTLCGEIGCRTAPLGSGAVAVALDTRAGGMEAHLTLLRDARLRAVVPITSTPPPSSPASRAAIALLLLGVSASVRLVKGVVQCSDAGEVAALEAACDEPVRSASSLERVLTSLSVAADQAAREARALEDEALALEYLALRHSAWNHRHLLVTQSSTTEDSPCLQPPS